MSGSGGYFASLLAPAMSKVLTPGDVLGVASSKVSSSLSISMGTRVFILKNRDVIKPLFSKYDVIVLYSDWLPRRQLMPPSKDFLIFPMLFSAERSDVFRIP